MLDAWLASADRTPAPYSDFGVVDVTELAKPSDKVLKHVSGLLRDARVDPSFFQAAAQSLGWEEVEKWVQAAVPSGTTARRGQFGEVLCGAVMEEFHDFVVPVQKLQYAITAGQSLPSTDLLAVAIDEGGQAIEEASFIEVKLRTGADTGFGTLGYRQLKEDYGKRIPDILRFVVARLYERGDALLEPFFTYLARRDDANGIDTFRVFLVQDDAVWSETTLTNLNDEPVELNDLTVHVVRLAALKNLTDKAFAKIGVTSVTDDD